MLFHEKACKSEEKTMFFIKKASQKPIKPIKPSFQGLFPKTDKTNKTNTTK